MAWFYAKTASESRACEVLEAIFNAKDAKEFAKERKEGLDSATFAVKF